MGLYFFDTWGGKAWMIDDQGVECINEDDALQRAHTELGEMAVEELPNGLSTTTLAVRVRDISGLIIETSLTLKTVWSR